MFAASTRSVTRGLALRLPDVPMPATVPKAETQELTRNLTIQCVQQQQSPGMACAAQRPPLMRIANLDTYVCRNSNMTNQAGRQGSMHHLQTPFLLLVTSSRIRPISMPT